MQARRWLGFLAATSLSLAAGCQPHEASKPAVQPAMTIATEAAGPVPEGILVVRRAAGAPMSLTASDGTGLKLVSVVSKTVVEGPLAFTQLELAFDNPQPRTLEGHFDIVLPPKASVSRFAMKIGGEWQEAEVVETSAARIAYEDFLHRKQDPALLEQAAGNQFSVRVFPIPASGRKELVLSYVQELANEATPVVPLQGLPEVSSLDLVLTRPGASRPMQALKRERFVPSGDFGYKPGSDPASIAVKSGNYAVVRVKAPVEDRPDPLQSVVLLLDTSASRALGLEDGLKLVSELARKTAAEGGADAKLVVAAFDQVVDSVYEGSASGWSGAHEKLVRDRKALGASDPAAALRWAASRAKAIGARRVVVITDGVATAGEADAADVRRAAAFLGESGVERVDAIAAGGLRDDATMRAMVTAGLARDGVVIDADKDRDRIGWKLAHLTKSGLAVRAEGARWWWPQTIDGAQPGDEAVVYVEGDDTASVRISIGGAAAQAYPLSPADAPLIERSVASARVDSLLAEIARKGRSTELVQRVVDLSTHYRVSSPFTSFLVLETDADYERFKIDRKAKADILVVEGARVASVGRERLRAIARDDAEKKAVVAQEEGAARETEAPALRPGAAAARPPSAQQTANTARPAAAPREPAAPQSPGAPAAAPPPAADAIGEAYGAGGLGLSGIAEGGGGRGEGIGLGSIGSIGHGAGTGSGQGFGSGQGRLGGAHRTHPPQVRMGQTQVNGRIPPEVIQRIVRQNYGRFRLCYENGLRANPNLQGRVAVRFVIDRQGSVSSVANAGSDLPSAAVVSCVVNAFRGLSFPQPEGGIVTVVYPIMFSPSDDSPSYARTQPESEKPAKADPYTGMFKEVMGELGTGRVDAAFAKASDWQQREPGDILALVALGEAAEAKGDPRLASRAYGSIIDLFPARADLRRFAGNRLDRVKETEARQLALDTYAKARAQRPDHPSSHRLLAFAQLRLGKYQEAFETLEQALGREYPPGRFAGVLRVIQEDLGLVAAAWSLAEPARKDEILKRLQKAGGTQEKEPSLRFVLTWETDANDVDFHIFDDHGGHAYYGRKQLPNAGGELYADVTTGYGPECFTIRKPKSQRSNYTLQANYYSRGPMGYGMGKLQVIDHDGKGGLKVEERPFVVMVDRGFVDMGAVKK